VRHTSRHTSTTTVNRSNRERDQKTPHSEPEDSQQNLRIKPHALVPAKHRLIFAECSESSSVARKKPSP
jgi:hypothetical protein